MRSTWNMGVSWRSFRRDMRSGAYVRARPAARARCSCAVYALNAVCLITRSSRENVMAAGKRGEAGGR